MGSVRLSSVADARIAQNGAAQTGAGASDALPVGLYSGFLFRSLVKFTLPDWTALHVRRVTKATLILKNTSEVYVARGGSPRILVKRALSGWKEGSAVSLSSSNAVTWANQPGTTTTGMTTSATLSTLNGNWQYIDVTAIVRAWAPSGVEGGGGKPNYGFALHSYDEGSTSRTTEFYSRESAYDPLLIIEYESNTTPGAPTDLSPAIESGGAGGIALLSHPSSTVALARFSGTRSDPDPGDYVTGVQIQIFADAATDAVPGSALIDRTFTAFTGQPVTFGLDVDVHALTVGTNYRWRARTRDKGLAWGPWSPLADSRFRVNTAPAAPFNPAVDTTTITPTFYGSLVDPDAGAAIGEVRIVVYEDTPAGTIQKWDSGFVASGGTRFAITYGGSPLEVGTKYRWASQIRDNLGSEGPLGSFMTWTPADVTGPSNMTPRSVETKQDSLTPNLTIGHSAAFDAYELEVARYPDGSSILWDVPVTTHASTTSKVVAYAGTALTWGRTYYWRAKIRVGGTTWSEWSPWYPFYVNALPDAPVGAITAAGQQVVDSGDHWTVTTLTPTLVFPFSDADVAKGYAEAATRREIEIRRADTLAAVSGSPFVITSGITDSFAIPGATLTADVVYEARARYDDSSNQRSAWSDWFRFKPSTAPTATEAATVLTDDPAPTIDWTFASSPGKAQAAFRVIVTDVTAAKTVHDSGVVSSADTSYVVPGEILADATQYDYLVTVFDTDLLAATLDGTAWTTAFTTPDELTGLVATPDPDDSSIDLAWDVTALDATHFWRYYVYRLDPDVGEYVRIGSVDDRDDPTFTDLAAPHGGATYAVTVSNGWAESDAITASAVLDLGWWVADPADPTLRFEIRYVSGYRARHDQQQEAFEPLGRDAPLVVSGEQLPPAGTFTVTNLADNPELLGLLKRAARVTPYVVLKSPFGDSLKVKLGAIDQDRGQAGVQTLNVEYRTVAR